MSLPENYNRIVTVQDKASLVARFNDNTVNCRVLPRTLPADIDFAKAACDIADAQKTLDIDTGILNGMRATLPAASRTAVDYILADMADYGFNSLRVIRSDGHYRDAETGSNFIGRFHADQGGGSNIRMGRLCCVYNGAVTEGLRNDEAVHADTRATVQRYAQRLSVRAEARDLFPRESRPNDSLMSFDYEGQLYFPQKGAKIFTFNTGDIWHQSVASSACNLPPFIHRAPAGPLPRRPEDPSKTIPRLLLIGAARA